MRADPTITPVGNLPRISSSASSMDEPFTIQVKGKPFVVVPHTIEHNDIVLFEARHFSAAAFAQD
jgi:hypothetical protein